MGAIFRVPIDHAAEPTADIQRVALVPTAERPLWDVDLRRPTVFVVGAERHGLPEELVESADVLAAIPQAPDAESLNAAAAATLALYEAVRQRST
jgi:TrmH family RNA methyltransferase